MNPAQDYEQAPARLGRSTQQFTDVFIRHQPTGAGALGLPPRVVLSSGVDPPSGVSGPTRHMPGNNRGHEATRARAEDGGAAATPASEPSARNFFPLTDVDAP